MTIEEKEEGEGKKKGKTGEKRGGRDKS